MVGDSEGFELDTLPSSVDQLPDPDTCAEIVLIWIYAGMVVHPFHKLLRSQLERDRLIIERYRAGESRASIAADFGLTVRRVGYIVKNEMKRAEYQRD